MDYSAWVGLYTFIGMFALFILMSVLAADSGISKNAYDTASKWLGKLRYHIDNLLCHLPFCNPRSASLWSSIPGDERLFMPQLDWIDFKFDEFVSLEYRDCQGTFPP